MTGYSAERSIGARIAAARRHRGYRTTKELAAAMTGTGISVAILENIESGRRANLDISTVLNIAHTLRIPVVALLAPISRPNDAVDLPNLNDTLASMTAAQFDGWLTGTTTGAYTAPTADERTDLAEMNALRDLQTARRELHRLEVTARLGDAIPELLQQLSATQLHAARARIETLETYLRSAGWEI